ncbi:MAG: hypothetical protein K2H22_07985 [Muribaculaceae bacterium]|nr:hypothetical protein [Muribaculaceae bacterium]
MDKRTIIPIAIVSMCLTFGMSCEKIEVTRSIDSDDNEVRTSDSIVIEDTVDIEANSGIIFGLGSDSLEVEIEDLHFHPQNWEEESVNTDL